MKTYKISDLLSGLLEFGEDNLIMDASSEDKKAAVLIKQDLHFVGEHIKIYNDIFVGRKQQSKKMSPIFFSYQ